MYLDVTAGVAVNSHGHIFLFMFMRAKSHRHAGTGLPLGYVHHAWTQSGTVRGGRISGRVHKLSQEEKVLGVQNESGKRRNRDFWA